MAIGTIEEKERSGLRFDKLGIIIAALAAYGAFLAPFATFKANRIVQGEAKAIWEALPPALGYGLLALVSLAAILAFVKSPVSVRVAAVLRCTPW